MAIINGTFDTDLSGWTTSGDVSWDNGRARIGYGGVIYQVLIIDDNILEFDRDATGSSSTDSESGCRIYINDVLKTDRRFGTGSIREKFYLGNYIGQTLKVEFYEVYGWTLWIDNVTFGHVTGIYNGTFDEGLAGWETVGEVIQETCDDWDPPRCSGNIASIYNGGRLSQKFIIDRCTLSFDWFFNSYPETGTEYEIYIDNTLFTTGQLQQQSNYIGRGIETIDISNYIGHWAEIVFNNLTGYVLAIDNVSTEIDAFGISVISYPSGADIYLDDIPTGQTTGDTPIIIDATTEGPHTVALKMAGYADYVETVDVVRCTVSYISGVFEGCITFITNPIGSKICIDDTDTQQTTPKTFCGYSVGSSHTYSLYLRDYRIETDTITFGANKGILINKSLVYQTGSAQFSVTPNGSRIIIDGIDTGKVTPDTIGDIPIGYHSYEIRLDEYYSLTGSFRSILDKTKQITGTIQQIIGVINGKFDTDLDGWTIINPNPSNGDIIWDNGRAYLYGHDITGLTIYKDITVIDDYLIFEYTIGDLRMTCDAGWNVIINPDTPEATTVANWCSGATGHQGGRFEADVSQHIGKIARILFYLTCTRKFSGYCQAWVDNVGNVPKPVRSITFSTYCTTDVDCSLTIPEISQCPAQISVDGNIIGYGTTITDVSLGQHSWQLLKDNHYTIETLSRYITGNIIFYQGTPAHIYVDNIYEPAKQIEQFYYESLERVGNSSCAPPYTRHSINMPGTYYQGKIRYVWDVFPGYAWAGIYTQIYKNTEPIGELHDTGMANFGDILHFEEIVDVILDAGDTISLMGWGKGGTYSCETFDIRNMIVESMPSLPPSPECIIKRDEGIYSKPKYCYAGEGIFIKIL